MKLIRIILVLFATGMVVHSQAQVCETQYGYSYIPLYVSVYTTCPNKWNIQVNKSDDGVDATPYCEGGYGCYQIDLFKDGSPVPGAEWYTNDETFGVSIPAIDNSQYFLMITTKYEVEEDDCGGFLIWYDYSEVFTNTVFCVDNVTYTGVSSGAGTLNFDTRANSYIHTTGSVTVNSGTTVKFHSNEITLGPGFLAESGSVFLTKIEGCTVLSTCTTKVDQTKALNYEVIGSSSSVVSDKKEKDISVYPNPSSGIFLINSSGNIDNVEILNSLGDIISNGTVVSQIDLSGQPEGLYLFKITSNGNTVVRKVIKK